MSFEIKKGLDIPIAGQPVQAIKPGPSIRTVALLGDDYIGMRPRLLVGEGDSVKLGQPVFEDKKNEGVVFTSPACGTVQSINRGAKRRFLSMVIEVNGNDEVTFGSHKDLSELERDQIRDQLVASGLWTALRTRPFDKVPAIDSIPNSIFVTAMDTNPLSAEPELIVAENTELFVAGLNVISRLSGGRTYVCTRNDSRVPGSDIANVYFEEFEGPHPAGLVGTHIHLLDPVTPTKTVWHIGYQDVIAIGQLFTTGKIMTERVVAVGGPVVNKPTLYRTRLGACVNELHVSKEENERIISGSILCGRTSAEPENFLGRYHTQISVLEEGNKREFLGWQGPGFNKFSITRIYAGAFGVGKKFAMNTNLNGSKRAMVPVGTYERVMPLDMMPTQLLRALITNDTDLAQDLGCLELGEEDLGLCTYVCPGKYDFGSILRDNLTQIEKEG